MFGVWIKLLIQHCAPQHVLTQAVGWLARCPWRWVKSAFIRGFASYFKVDMHDAQQPDLAEYECFNDFFTRALTPGARPISAHKRAIISPVDGAVGQFGRVQAGRLIQAKGQSYSVEELLGGVPHRARHFEKGSFFTTYLAPKDYHRVHFPLSGTLHQMLYVPGRLFSVSPFVVSHIPRVFARNERVVVLFNTKAGRVAVVLIGAIIVGSIQTEWAGVVAPPRSKHIQQWNYDHQEMRYNMGDELGLFKVGSCVVMLFENPDVAWNNGLAVGHSLKMGQEIAQWEV